MTQFADHSDQGNHPFHFQERHAVPPMVSVVGYSGAGKTTLLEKLISELTSRGFRIGTIKHDVHGFQMDKPGKDSWRHKQAGALTTIISSPRQIGMVKDVQAELGPAALLPLLSDVDMVLLEGYKQADHPKIEIFREEVHSELVCPGDKNLIAFVTNTTLDTDVPQFPLHDIAGLADFLIGYFIAKAP